MTSIANQGLNALVDAAKFLNTLKLAADAMARPGGTVRSSNQGNFKMKDL